MKKLNGVSIEKVVFALKCQAVADALGDRFEFQPSPEAEDLDALISSDSPIRITDDTQMTLFGFQAYLDHLKTEESLHVLIKRNYLYWYDTQHLPFKGMRTGLMNFQSLYVRRAPGGTCLSSLQRLSANQSVRNTSNGCGTVMRGLPFVFQIDTKTYQWASELTHGGVTIKDTAKDHHSYLRGLLKEKDDNWAWFRGYEFEEIFGNGGWSANPCFQIGAWSLEHCFGDFHSLLHISILHGGDSDSTAAVAGAMYGLKYSEDTDMVERLYKRVKEKDAIDHIIGRLRAINCTEAP